MLLYFVQCEIDLWKTSAKPQSVTDASNEFPFLKLLMQVVC